MWLYSPLLYLFLHIILRCPCDSVIIHEQENILLNQHRNGQIELLVHQRQPCQNCLPHKHNEMAIRCKMFWQKCRAHKNNRINRLKMTFHLYRLLTESLKCVEHNKVQRLLEPEIRGIFAIGNQLWCVLWRQYAQYGKCDGKVNSTFKHVLFALIQYPSTFRILSLLPVMRYESSQTAYIISGRADGLYICRMQHIWDFNILHLIDHICCNCKYLHFVLEDFILCFGQSLVCVCFATVNLILCLFAANLSLKQASVLQQSYGKIWSVLLCFVLLMVDVSAKTHEFSSQSLICVWDTVLLLYLVVFVQHFRVLTVVFSGCV